MDKAAMIYIVDDDQDACHSAYSLVTQLGYTACQFASAQEFLTHYNGHRPAVLLTDYRMPRMTGVELVEKLRASGISIATIIMTAFAETELTVRAIRSGATTLIEKPYSRQSLTAAIEEALAQDRECTASEHRLNQIIDRFETLSERELEVVTRIVQGHSNRVVAQDLDVSIRTIESRRSKAFAKMNVTSLAELVQLVMISRPEICSAVTNLNLV